MATVPRTDRQPRRRLDPDQRREAILAAASEAFADATYAEVTVSAIAARAGASEALLYRYFTGKDQLYTELVRSMLDTLLERQAATVEALPDGVPVRDRVRATTIVYLDHIATHPREWATPLSRPGSEPAATADVRAAARRSSVERLGDLLTPSGARRHDYAVWGYFGFLDTACLRWVQLGCPADDRWALIDAALGALEGALGDWAA
jgi:AcrR family transcriptional regulator